MLLEKLGKLPKPIYTFTENLTTFNNEQPNYTIVEFVSMSVFVCYGYTTVINNVQNSDLIFSKFFCYIRSGKYFFVRDDLL